MALEGVFGSLGLGSINFSAILSKVYYFAGIFLLLLVVGAIFGGMFMLKKKKGKNKVTKKIGWWDDNGIKMIPAEMQTVEEISIPGTTLKVFYDKKVDLWLPRFTRGITPKLFYVARTEDGQMINFTITGLSAELKKAKVDFDHTDMLWASENTREFIKRNYRDKSVKWWQLYKDAISTAIHILIHTFSFIIIIYFLKGVVDDIGGVASGLSEAVKQLQMCGANSGIVPAIIGGLKIRK